ncbi:molybdopterin molybdotransferase MoeA [Streptomyces sp. TR06-5]|uniref:molybdopterin molybdotransferase MoeA n=1 Tax=Streptomyces sp. TR06-5 TaxID=3385976 RepID=UPI0039A10E21
MPPERHRTPAASRTAEEEHPPGSGGRAAPQDASPAVVPGQDRTRAAPAPAPPAERQAPGAQRPAAPPPGHATWDGARRAAARAAGAAPAVSVPLDRAAGGVLAAPVEALADLPSFDTAAMDGWAVAGPGPWETVGPPHDPGVLAGAADPAPLPDGCAVRIATGARMPVGATAVLRSEYAVPHGGRLRRASEAPGTEGGTDVRPRGQECRAGDRLLPAGTPVTPPVLGLAAAAGYDRLTVTPRPRAEVLVLGDELLPAGLPSEGRIRDALGPMVGPWLAALGAEVLATRRIGDDAEALHEALTTSTADLVVTTGGTAHGPVDHLRPTLRRLDAELLVDGVEVRPGHPMLLAALSGGQTGRHVVGLPGNPLAAVSGLLTLAEPLLRTRAGLPEPEPVRATLTAAVAGHPRDTRLVPVVRSADGAGATPLRWRGPAMLRGVAAACALAAVPPGGAAAGTSVRLLELPW